MTNEKHTKKEIPKSYYNFYNGGKFGKIDEFNLNEKLLNRRLVSDEHFATIKYIGNIPKSNEIWLGVDWDEESRGRHDGMREGIKYFNTWHPTSGSFVRPNKVSRGMTMEEAINMRYGNSDDPDFNYILDEFFLESSDSDDECGSSSTVSRPNKQHQKVKVHISGPATCAFNVHSGMMDRIKSLILHSLPVFRCMTELEGGHRLGEMVPMATELDIAQTLICDWLDVAKILVQLPAIVNLNVSDNKLLPLFPTLLTGCGDDKAACVSATGHEEDDETSLRSQSYKAGFASIRHIVMVRIYYSWSQYYQLFDFFPRLQHVCLAYNRLSLLCPTMHPNFTGLVYLDIACNEIDDFSASVLPYGSLQNLETLLMNENKIEKIELPGPVSEDSDLFPKLRLLAISNNCINSWDTLHHVARMRSLRELIFMFNPILERQKNPETARQDVIAKVGRLKILNRNEVKYDERKGAEIDYMKRYGKIWLESQPVTSDDEASEAAEKKRQIVQQFHLDHPRFMKLADLYGAPDQSDVKDVSLKLKERLIEVVFEYPAAATTAGSEASAEWRTTKKRIPTHMTVQHLRSLLRRVCKLSTRCEFSLAYVSAARPLLHIPLEADTREIGFYNVQSGDKVILHLLV